MVETGQGEMSTVQALTTTEHGNHSNFKKSKLSHWVCHYNEIRTNEQIKANLVMESEESGKFSQEISWFDLRGDDVFMLAVIGC